MRRLHVLLLGLGLLGVACSTTPADTTSTGSSTSISPAPGPIAEGDPTFGTASPQIGCGPIPEGSVVALTSRGFGTGTTAPLAEAGIAPVFMEPTIDAVGARIHSSYLARLGLSPDAGSFPIWWEPLLLDDLATWQETYNAVLLPAAVELQPESQHALLIVLELDPPEVVHDDVPTISSEILVTSWQYTIGDSATFDLRPKTHVLFAPNRPISGWRPDTCEPEWSELSDHPLEEMFPAGDEPPLVLRRSPGE